MSRKDFPFVPAERSVSSLQFSRTLSPGSMTQLHQHDEYELAALVSGAGWCDLPNETVPMEGGNLYLLPPGTPHMMRYFDLTPHVMYHVMFRPSLLEQLRQEFGVDLQAPLSSCRVFTLTEELQRRLDQAHSAASESENPLDQGIRHMLVKCVLLTIAKQLGVPAPGAAAPPNAHPQLAEALRYLREHYAEEISLPLLARRCGLSPAYLCRLCRRETGLTPGQYLLRTRIERACCLLEETDLNVSQIALRTGFNSTAYFDRRFRLQMGLSPSEYLTRRRELLLRRPEEDR